MSDSDEESESVSMTGFLFGNIDMKTGQLEDDILDDESKRQLNALQKFGLGSMMSAVMSDGSEQPVKRPVKQKSSKRRRPYDDSSDSDASSDSDSDDEEQESLSSLKSDELNSELSSEASSSLPPPDKQYFATSSQDDDDYDEEKSPTAVDFSDINELAEEDLNSLQSARDTRTYSKDSSEDSDDGGDYDVGEKPGKHVRRLFDDKTLMPPPVTTRVKKISGYESGTESPTKSISNKTALALAMEAAASKLETPLAAMMPSKYAGINVSEIFPDFRTGKVLRFSRLFGPGKQSSLPNTWKTVKRRRRKRKILVEGQAAADLAEERDRERRGWDFQYCDNLSSSEEESDDEATLCSEDSTPKKNEGKELGISRLGPPLPVPPASIWRHGPAQLWYDMLNVPEDGENFDYGFQLKKTENEDQEKSSSEEETNENESEKENKIGYPDEAFHMITQRDWESEVIWDGSDTKYKKSTKNKAAGWVPSGVNRTAPGAGGSTPGGPASTSSASTSIPGTPPGASGTPRKDDKAAATPSPKSKIIAAAKAAAAAQALGYGEEGGQVDDTWYSIFPVETSELVYGRWEDDVIWDADEMEEIPQPRILALDPNDENIVLCIPDDVDPSAAQGATAPVKVKIPHPHVKKSKILLGKAGVINVIEEDSPPPSPKNDDKDPYNVSNDEYYMPKFTEQSLLKISASGNIIQHSTPVVELRAPFIPTYMSQRGLRAFHRPGMRMFKTDDPKRAAFSPFIHPGPHPVLPLLKHIKKKAKVSLSIGFNSR